MTQIKLIDDWTTIAAAPTTEDPALNRLAEPENWYAEPFTKRTACNTPGQCGGDCDCGCPYNTMSELDRLPRIADIAQIFPNEWLAFIISAEEDEELEPIHGKLVAHSPHPDDIYDAANTVLWNQHVYIYFNGDFEQMQASYGADWAEDNDSPEQRTYSGPKQILEAAAAAPDPLPAGVIDLIYSAIDKLYGSPDLNEAIRRLRLSRVRAALAQNKPLVTILDAALDKVEGPLPRLNEVVWFLEEALAELEVVA